MNIKMLCTRQELRGTGVRLISILPGWVDTPGLEAVFRLEEIVILSSNSVAFINPSQSYFILTYFSPISAARYHNDDILRDDGSTKVMEMYGYGDKDTLRSV